MEARPQHQRVENVLEALRLAAVIVNTAKGTEERVSDVIVKRNQVQYSDGTGTFTITVESRNFMDDRRDAVAAQEKTP